MKKLLFCIFGIIFILLSFVNAEDGCYVSVEIDENFFNGNLYLGFNGIQNMYGQYDFLVNNYREDYSDFYALGVYDIYGNLINKYLFGTGLIGVDNNAELVVSDSGQTRVVIPYNSNINSLRAFSGDLIFDLEGFDKNSLRCEKTCKDFNETGVWDVDVCCGGLTRKQIDLSNFLCISCGDGRCQDNEDFYSCARDCSRNNIECLNGYIKTKYGCVQPNIFGNGIVEQDEKCDDGNLLNFDGCDSSGGVEECIVLKDGSISSFGDFFGGTCVDDSKLKKFYCGYNLQWNFWNMKKVAKSSIIECEFGCSRGVCLKDVPVVNQTINETLSNCFDSDGGFDYYTFGNTTHVPTGQLIEEDFCDSDISLVEQACFGQGYGKSYIYYDCPNGCLDGKCVVLDLPDEPEEPGVI